MADGANLFQDAGRKKELFDLYRHAVARGVPFYDAYHSLGNLAIEQGDVNVAARMFQRAIEIDPADPAGYESLGEVYCRLGKYKKAVVFLKKSLEIDPKLAVAHNNIAVAYYYLHRYDQAVFHCDKAVALGYRTEPKLLDLLKPYKKQGQKPQEARVSHF